MKNIKYPMTYNGYWNKEYVLIMQQEKNAYASTTVIRFIYMVCRKSATNESNDEYIENNIDIKTQLQRCILGKLSIQRHIMMFRKSFIYVIHVEGKHTQYTYVLIFDESIPKSDCTEFISRALFYYFKDTVCIRIKI